MKVACAQCNKEYNFKNEKLPPYGFSFRCKQCNERIQVSQAQVDDARAAESPDNKKAGKVFKKLPKLSMPTIPTEKLKRPLIKASGVAARLARQPESEKITFFTKMIAYFSIGMLFVVIGLGTLIWFSIGSGKTVTFAEVQRSLELKRDPLVELQKAVPDIPLSDLIRQHIGDEYREEFVEWMNGLHKHQRKDFIRNLESIINQSRLLGPQHIPEYMREYQKLKFHRAAIGPFSNYLLKFGLIVALLAAVCLLALFSVVLLEILAQKPKARPAKAAPKRLRSVKKRAAAMSANPRKK